MTKRQPPILFVLFLITASVAVSHSATAETTTVDPSTLTPGPIRHKELPPALVDRIKAFEKVFAEVYPITHEEWIEGFQRDMHPEREIAIWERIASALTRFTAGQTLPLALRKEAFELLVVRSGTSSENALKRVDLKYLTPEDAKKLVELY